MVWKSPEYPPVKGPGGVNRLFSLLDPRREKVPKW